MGAIYTNEIEVRSYTLRTPKMLVGQKNNEFMSQFAF